MWVLVHLPLARGDGGVRCLKGRRLSFVAGFCGAIDASTMAPQVKILVVQVRSQLAVTLNRSRLCRPWFFGVARLYLLHSSYSK